MAVAHESTTESHTGTTGSTNQASYDIDKSGTGNVPFTASTKGLLVFAFNRTSTSGASSVKIDPLGANIDVPAVTGGKANDVAGEPGTCKVFFLGSGLPTVTTLVRVNRLNDADTHYAVAITVTANNDTQIEGTPVLLQDNGTWAEQTVGTAGVQSQGYAGSHNGGSTVNPPGANSTALDSIDYGNITSDTCRETTSPGSTGTKTVGFSQAVADDRAAVHVAISEVAAAATPTLPPQSWRIVKGRRARFRRRAA